jgi:hypothetical protein
MFRKILKLVDGENKGFLFNTKKLKHILQKYFQKMQENPHLLKDFTDPSFLQNFQHYREKYFIIKIIKKMQEKLRNMYVYKQHFSVDEFYKIFNEIMQDIATKKKRYCDKKEPNKIDIPFYL